MRFVKYLAFLTVAGASFFAGRTVMSVAEPEVIVEHVPEKHPEPPETTFVEVEVKATAYCPCSRCCGRFADGMTSMGRDAGFPGVAVDPKRIPYGTIIEIPGIGKLEADDTGSAMRNAEGLHIDIRFRTHEEALQWGVQTIVVKIFERRKQANLVNGTEKTR